MIETGSKISKNGTALEKERDVGREPKETIMQEQ